MHKTMAGVRNFASLKEIMLLYFHTCGACYPSVLCGNSYSIFQVDHIGKFGICKWCKCILNSSCMATDLEMILPPPDYAY